MPCSSAEYKIMVFRVMFLLSSAGHSFNSVYSYYSYIPFFYAL